MTADHRPMLYLPGMKAPHGLMARDGLLQREPGQAAMYEGIALSGLCLALLLATNNLGLIPALPELAVGMATGTLLSVGSHNQDHGNSLRVGTVKLLERFAIGAAPVFALRHPDAIWDFVNFAGQNLWLVGATLGFLGDCVRNLHEDGTFGFSSIPRLGRKLGTTAAGAVGMETLQLTGSLEAGTRLTMASVGTALMLGVTELATHVHHHRLTIAEQTQTMEDQHKTLVERVTQLNKISQILSGDQD